MKKVKQIQRVELKSARRLTPLELNSIRIERQHTVLTPDKLGKKTEKS